MTLLTVTGIAKHFGGVVALDGADLAVEAGTITGLIGPNGAGKTTLFNVISGLIKPDAGAVVLDGEDVTGWRPDRIARRGMVRSFQIARGFPLLTVMENLLVYGPSQPGEAMAALFFARSRAVAAERALIARARTIAARLDLEAVLDRRASEISGGQKKLLEIGRALMAEPKLVLLDEPIAGVNPALADRIAHHLVDLRNEGLTILLIEHNMDMIARLCDPVVVMAAGRKLTQGRFADVAADATVQEAYMGKRRWTS
jgi:branched-chain amino acid transport system ATP-binding protein/neutral amino acid transport system ATP-binding protein